MKIFWLRPSAGDSQQSAIVYQKQQQEAVKQVITPKRESTKFPFHLSLEKAKWIIDNVDNKILGNQVRALLSAPVKTGQQCDDFQHSHEQIFKKNENNYQMKTLVLTLDYYMNIQTFYCFYIGNYLETARNQQSQKGYQSGQLKLDYLMEHFIHFLFDNRIQLRQVKPYEIIPKPLIGYEEMDLFSLDPAVLSNVITEINEEFYSQLQFNNLLTNLDNGKQSQFLSEYFDRINSFSLYIQTTILKKKDRKKAIDYFYEVCLELCKNEDGEGVFLLFTLSIERLDQDLLHSIQYISPIQQQILIDMTKTFVCNKHIYTPSTTKKLYPIPSFYHFWTKLKNQNRQLNKVKT